MYRDRGLVMAGVEVWNSSRDGVITYQTGAGATHTLCLNGYQTMQNSYQAGKNTYYVIDQTGAIRFIDSLTGTVYYSEIDDLATRIAALVDSLLPPAGIAVQTLASPKVESWFTGERLVFNLDQAQRFSVTVYDIRGRRLAGLPVQDWPKGKQEVALRLPQGMGVAVLKGPGLNRAVPYVFCR